MEPLSRPWQPCSSIVLIRRIFGVEVCSRIPGKLVRFFGSPIGAAYVADVLDRQKCPAAVSKKQKPLKRMYKKQKQALNMIGFGSKKAVNSFRGGAPLEWKHDEYHRGWSFNGLYSSDSPTVT